MRSQSSRHKFLASAVTAALFLIIGIRFVVPAESKASHNGIPSKADDTTQEKIARAMSAGPDNISESARIVDKDTQGKPVVLRQGSNGFTCMPGNPKVVGQPPMCADAASMQWAADFKVHKPKPTNTVPGITYMLAGATQRSDTDPFDTTSPALCVSPGSMRCDIPCIGIPVGPSRHFLEERRITVLRKAVGLAAAAARAQSSFRRSRISLWHSAC